LKTFQHVFILSASTSKPPENRHGVLHDPGEPNTSLPKESANAITPPDLNYYGRQPYPTILNYVLNLPTTRPNGTLQPASETRFFDHTGMTMHQRLHTIYSTLPKIQPCRLSTFP
jgi:hypothetical protein